MIFPILKYGDPRLEQAAHPVNPEQFGSPNLAFIIKNMFETLHASKGIGLAATQLGIMMRLAVIDVDGAHPLALVNPEILLEEGFCEEPEGCLSVGHFRAVPRARKCTVRAWDVNGLQHEIAGEGIVARVLQHEIDHLDGVLFLERIGAIRREMVKKKLAKIDS